MPETSPAELLRKGLQLLEIDCGEPCIAQFLLYLSELKKWNRVHNLTALKTDHDIIIKHFLDSLLFCKVLPPAPRTLADVGSGAGFPGIPIKIARPDLKTYLIEPAPKKAAFLRHICLKLGLSEIEVIDKKIEEVSGVNADVCVTRALFTVEEFKSRAAGLLSERGVLILSKGPKLEEELAGLNPDGIRITKLRLPFEKAERRLVSVSSTPE